MIFYDDLTRTLSNRPAEKHSATTPMGFVEDGSNYCLLSPAEPEKGSVEMALIEWLQTVG